MEGVDHKRAAAPPPPPGLGFRPKKPSAVATKLKRSSHMSNLYTRVKGKVEGSSKPSRPERKPRFGAAAAAAGGGKQGMADALAEISKRSVYFQQIEEDVKKYAGAVKEVKIAISSFKTSDKAELIKFNKYVESHLEKLTDENQVLVRFEDFPHKKLEALRMAAALYTKLDTIANTLKNWPIVSPVAQLLDKADQYLSKRTYPDQVATRRTGADQRPRHEGVAISKYHFRFLRSYTHQRADGGSLFQLHGLGT
ncbi:hypothetical protein ABFX02_13G110000 [Erythranthe guttata]